MKIYVLGANGMLGTYLHKYFKDSIAITKNELNALDINRLSLFNKIELTGVKAGDVILNATGITNKRDSVDLDFIKVNSVFPRLLSDFCYKEGIKLIHISTDCVYSGKTGCYRENDPHDESNIYGLSKSAGESLICTVIRTSIIGENKNNNRDLLEWVKLTKNGTINGYRNHYWNGITCLEYAKVCDYIINNNKFWLGVRHIHSPKPITKDRLVELISETYELNNKIISVDAPFYCNRILYSDYDSEIKFIPSIKEQIIEQRNFNIR